MYSNEDKDCVLIMTRNKKDKDKKNKSMFGLRNMNK